MSEPSTNLPVVTVIIPCHNYGNTVQRAITSVAEQTYPSESRRVFVSDEGSTDDTWEKLTDPSFYDGPLEDVGSDNTGRIVLLGSKNDMAVYIVKQPKGDGPSPARNRLIKMSWDLTDFYSILDADDYYLPTKLEKTVAIMANDPKFVGLVYNDALIHNERTGNTVYEFREPYNRIRMERECITSNTPLINKTALQQVGLYDEEMRTAEDWDLALRITAGFVAIHIPEALHVYSVTGRNSSDTVDMAVWQRNWQRIAQKVQAQKHGK